MRVTAFAAVAACLFCSASPAAAAQNVPIPAEFFITVGGLDWAWASPCSATAPSCGDTTLLDYQGTQGWHLPTVGEYAIRPDASAFGTSTNFKCATPYFSDTYQHCDYGDAVAGFVWDPSLGTSNNGGTETWMVRGALAAGVPEPGTWAMMLLGFGAIGFSFRRRRDGRQLQAA